MKDEDNFKIFFYKQQNPGDKRSQITYKATTITGGSTIRGKEVVDWKLIIKAISECYKNQ